MLMNVMDVTIEDQNPQSLTTVMEGTFSSGDGSEPPFLSIPSPLELHALYQVYPVGENPQGGVGSSREGVSGLRPPFLGLTPEKLGLLGSTHFIWPSNC